MSYKDDIDKWGDDLDGCLRWSTSAAASMGIRDMTWELMKGARSEARTVFSDVLYPDRNCLITTLVGDGPFGSYDDDSYD